jgi:exopolysaccharide biosynthesis protein
VVKIKYIWIIIVLFAVAETKSYAVEYDKVIETDKYSYICTKPQNLKVYISRKGMTVNEFVRKNKNVIAAINGTFFDKDSSDYFPTGLVIKEGKVEWKSTLEVAAGKCKTRKSAKLRNKARSDSKWYRVFYTTKDGNAGIMTVNDYKEKIADKKYLSGIELAFEAGPLLVKNKEIQYEEFKNRPSRDKTVRRSVIGITPGGDIMIFYSSKGYTLPGLAQALIDLGITKAINLDGGSSSSFASPGAKSRSVKVNTIFYVEKQK